MLIITYKDTTKQCAFFDMYTFYKARYGHVSLQENGENL